MTFSQFQKPRYKLVEEEHSLRDSSTYEASFEGLNTKEKEREESLTSSPLGSIGQDAQSGQEIDTSEMRGTSPVFTDGLSISTTSARNLWKAYRVSGYQRLILSLLQRGGCETSMELALQLLRDMALKEQLTMHQSQVRSLLHCAILNDQAQAVPSADGNLSPKLESDSPNRLKPSAKEEG